MIIFVPKNYDQVFLNNLLKQTKFYDLKNQWIKYLDSKYQNKETLAFIKMLIFNDKDNLILEFYNYSKFLGIVHLITISGFHINALLWVFKKIIRNEKANKYFSLFFVLFYGYFLQYSISILRQLFTILFSFRFQKQKAFILSGILNCFLFINIMKYLGFILSYGCIICINKIQNYNISNFFKVLIINLLCTFFSFIVLININYKFNLLILFFNLMFSPIIICLYFWTLITFMIFPLQNIQTSIYLAFKQLFCFLSNLNIFVSLNKDICKITQFCSSAFFIFWWNK